MVLIKGFGLWLRERHSVPNMNFLWLEIWNFQRFVNLLFSLEILLVQWNFQKMSQQSFSIIFFLIFSIMVDNWNILKLTEPFFLGKFIFGQIQGKRAQNGLKIGFSRFFEKICCQFFKEVIQIKKLKLLLIFHHQSHSLKNSGSQVMDQIDVNQLNCTIL